MRSEKFPAPAPTTSKSSAPSRPLPTFLDHVHELRRRLFWVVGTILVAASVAYNFLNPIIDILTRPLGDMRLFYLTPGGGLSFSFKLCAYVGIVVAVPVIMFHLYRFLEPLMGTMRKSALFYVSLSTLLAFSGVLFAYFVSLPGALHFLTNFNMHQIQAMLTADSYLSFVLTYLLGAALLFQIPLLLLIINTMTPLKPSKLMKLQRFVMVGAFLLGAVISPTPDIMNQTLLALPIIGMYQLGVGMVWVQNRARVRKLARLQTVRQTVPAQPQPAASTTQRYVPNEVLQELAQRQRATAIQPAQLKQRPQSGPATRVVPRKVYSDIKPQAAQRSVRPASTGLRPRPVTPQRTRQLVRPFAPQRSIDGFRPYNTRAAAGAS